VNCLESMRVFTPRNSRDVALGAVLPVMLNGYSNRMGF
jgi:hypothetical protein